MPSVHIILFIRRLSKNLTNFNPHPLAARTEDFPLLLMIVISLAVGLLILTVAVILVLAVVIHMRQKRMYRSKYTVQLGVTYGVIFYLTQLFEL